MRRFASLLGYKSWAAKLPCIRCNATHRNLHNYDACSIAFHNPAWGNFDDEDWQTEILGHLRKIVLHSADEYKTFKDEVSLAYFHKKPFASRLVTLNGPRLNLHDKFLVGGSLGTIAEFDTLSSWPATLLIYRTKTSRLNFPCPFWEIPGVQPGVFGPNASHLSFDVLHTLDLGVTQ